MTLDRQRLMLVLERAHSGPICDTFTWDTQMMTRPISASLKKYGLQNTYNAARPINQDDDLADRFFEAAMDMVPEVGLLCMDTQRVIKFTRDEIREALQAAPARFTLGEGKDTVEYRHRMPEDTYPPIWAAPLSIVVTEDLFLAVAEGIARIPEVDCMEGPSMETIWGTKLRAGSPLELLGGKVQAQLMQKVLDRVGREGMGRYAVSTSPTHYGILGGYGAPGGYVPGRDLVLVLSPAEMRTSYEVLHKLCHAYNQGGEAKIYAGNWSYIGGSGGGPEGAALGCIACSLLLYAAYQPSTAAASILDFKYMANCGRRAQWALSVVFQALSRNTHTCSNVVLSQSAGPVTKMLLQELAVGMMNVAVSGASTCIGPRPNGGKYTNHITPLETQFGGEVVKKSAGMSREQASEIADRLLSLYEDRLVDPPKGKSYRECYDPETLQPSDEWKRIYDEVKREVTEMGIPLE